MLQVGWFGVAWYLIHHDANMKEAVLQRSTVLSTLFTSHTACSKRLQHCSCSKNVNTNFNGFWIGSGQNFDTLHAAVNLTNFNERLYFHIIPSHWLDGSFGMFHLPMWFNHKPQCGSQSMSSLSMLVILLLNQSYTAPVMAWISKHIRWDKSLNFNCSHSNYYRWILPLTHVMTAIQYIK
jgi:hypothetical protein